MDATPEENTQCDRKRQDLNGSSRDEIIIKNRHHCILNIPIDALPTPTNVATFAGVGRASMDMLVGLLYWSA